MIKIGTNSPKNYILFGAEIPSKSSAFSRVMLKESVESVIKELDYLRLIDKNDP